MDESFKDQVEVANEALLKKLRVIVQPPGKKGSWLRLLNDKQLLEVYYRLKMRQTTYLIVQVAQNEWNVMRGSPNRSLGRAVQDFKKKALSEIDLAVSAQPKKEQAGLMLNLRRRGVRTVKSLDGMGVLRWAILVQMDRVAMNYEREQQLKIPLKNAGPEIDILGRLADKYLLHGETLGLLETQPTEFNLTVKHSFDQMMKKLPPGGAGAMVEATKRFLHQAKEKAKPISLKRNENGTYSAEDYDEGTGSSGAGA